MSTGYASAHLVTYSTAVIMYLAPVLFASMGNGPMKSMAQISNVKLGFTDIKGIYVLAGVDLVVGICHIGLQSFCNLCEVSATITLIDGFSL